jgi:glutamine synthetase
MQHSSIANALFGEKFVQHFTQTRKHEWEQINVADPDWEIKRYFEII